VTKEALEQFLKDFKYLNRNYRVSFDGEKATIYASAILQDVDTGEDTTFGDYRVVKYQEVDEFQLLVIMRNWMMILALHELDEHIQYKGKKVFDPHKTLNYLY